MILPCVAAGLCVVGFRLWPKLRSTGDRSASRVLLGGGRVSVIIPARNEARNIPRLISSLQAGLSRPWEILVVDDGSTDGTASLAAEHGARVIRPGEPPDGWKGKTWACHQGATQAAGELLCFMDADTWMAGESAWQDLLERAGDGVFSVCPWHEVRRPYESLSLFFNLSMVLGTVPEGLFGQVLWIRKEDYGLCGGHAAVAQRVLENHGLAAHCRQAGLEIRSAVGRGLVSFRMYPGGLGELIGGWRKGFAAGAGATPSGLMVWIVIWLHGLMLAPISVALAPGCHVAWAVYVLAVAQVTLYARRVGSFPWWVGALYPLPLLFFFALFGWAKWSSGKPVTWKGRTIDAD